MSNHQLLLVLVPCFHHRRLILVLANLLGLLTIISSAYDIGVNVCKF